MKLINLKLENFQGLKSAEFEFNGKSVNIYGDNATGKTTVFNALTWLLFDKASTGAKGFTPKTKTLTGDVHYLEHAVEADFRLNNGRLITLRKVFHGVYKKKRGLAAVEFTGHTTDYFVDGVPNSEKEYTTTLINYGDTIEKMKTLTIPSYFAEDISWETRRQILLDLCGNISDIDIIRDTPELGQLLVYLLIPGTTDRYYSISEYRKIITTKKTEINRELQDIPGRIDEATRALPDITSINKDVINHTIKKLVEQKNVLDVEKTQVLGNDTMVFNIKTQIAELNTELARAQVAYITSNNNLNNETYTMIAVVEKEQVAANTRLINAKNDLKIAKQLIEHMTSQREKLLAEYKTIQSSVWNENAATCPTCQRLLQEEKILELRETFNLKKSIRLEEINQLGQNEASLALIATQTELVEMLEKTIIKEENSIKNFATQLATLHDQLQTLSPFETTAEYVKLTEQIAVLHEEAQNVDKRMQELTMIFTEKTHILQTEIQTQNELKSRFVVATIQQKRINELATREKELTRQYEILEQGIYLCEKFIKTKVSLLTERINSKFQSVSFRLFIEQLNGGIREDCEVMIPSEDGSLVPFAFANHGARVNAGLEIIDTLSRYWSMTMPVFIDNAESITKLLPVDTQVIRLVVSEQDKILRLEPYQTDTNVNSHVGDAKTKKIIITGPIF